MSINSVIQYCSLFFIFVLNVSFSAYFQTGKAEKDFYIELNYQLVNDSIIIPVEIEGKIYRFLLDTGAPNILSVELNNIISTSYINEVSIVDANNIKNELTVVTVPLIKINGVSFTNTSALVNDNDDNLIFNCYGIDGIIGSNILRHGIVQIRSKERIIKFTDIKKKLKLNRKHSSKIKLYGSQSMPAIKIKLKGNKKVSEQLFIDTGMSAFYSLSNRNLSSFQEKNSFDIMGESIGVIGSGIFGAEKKSKYFKLLIPEMKINKTTFKNITTITSNDQNSKLGVDLIKYGNMTIDFLHKRFYFEPFQSVNDLQEKSYDFDVTVIDDKVVIGTVWESNLQKQMESGDVVVEINGIDFSNIDLCDMLDSEKSIIRSSDELEMLILKPNGDKKKFSLRKKTL